MHSDALPEFIADGVSLDFVDALRDNIGLRLRQNRSDASDTSSNNQGASTFQQRKVLLCINPDDETFSRAISGNLSGLFEISEDRDLELSAGQIIENLQRGSWFSSVSSKHILNSTFVDQLSKKITLDHDVDSAERTLMGTAIGEAVSNGVVHGNLELNSPPMGGIDDFTTFYRKIDVRLNNSNYGNRHVMVQTWADSDGVWVCVTDEGLGYRPFKEKRAGGTETDGGSLPKEKRRSGRGLEIINTFSKEVRVDNEGRRISMRF